MPTYLFILLLCIVSLAASAQVVAIQADKENILYTCVENPITVAVSNVPPSQIVVSIDKGTIVKTPYAKPGKYTVYPAKKGYTTIYVSKRTPKGLKLIDSVNYRVKGIIKAQVSLGVTDNKITKSSLCKQLIPTAYTINYNIDSRLPVKGFTVSVYRDRKQIFTRKLQDDRLAEIDSVTHDFFTTVKSDDSVTFTDFIVTDCNGEITDVNSLAFTVTEAEKYSGHKHGDTEEMVNPITGEEYIKKW